MGDHVIQAVAEIRCTSLTDAAHAVTRYGSEAFAILLPQPPLQQCAHLAEAVRMRVKASKIRKRDTREMLCCR
jgi:PleD family two-component response regulator